MRQLITILILGFSFLQIQIANAQTRMDSLLVERQNFYQNFILKMDPKIFTDPNFVATINAMGSIDSMVSEEAHRIDSIFNANEKLSPLIGVTLENLRAKRDKAQTFFYISLLFLAFMIGLVIYLAEKVKNLNHKITFLETDISEVNNNYAMISEEKIILHRELNIKIKSLEQKIRALLVDNEKLISENKELIFNIEQLNIVKSNLSENSNRYITENKLFKEAVKLLENNKYDLEKEILKLKAESIDIKSPVDKEVENLKTEFTKRIEHLENALKTKDIMEGVIAKRNKELEDSFQNMTDHINQLSIELEDEKAYNEKLTAKVAFFEEEINDKEVELKTLWNKLSQQVAIKPFIKSDDPETNMLKTLEKLSRMKQADILSEDEYNSLKEKIISQY